MVNRSILRKNKLGYFSKLMFGANILAILVLLMSYSAAYIDPLKFWPIAFFGLAYLPILLINCGFIVYWLLRKRRNALFSCLAIIAGWGLMTKHINFRNKNTKLLVKADSNLRVMSYNVRLFKNSEMSGNTFKDETLEIVNTINPDVVCFQEFYSRIKGSKQFTKRLAKEVGFKEYYFNTSVQNEFEGYGQAIFSKFPILDYGAITENNYGINRIIYVDIKRGVDTLRIYNVHLRTFGLQDEEKDFIQKYPVEVKNEDRTRRLGKKLKRAFTNRSEQAKSLHEHIKKSPYPCILAGDFNDTPMSYSVSESAKDMRNAFQEQGFGWGVTHYSLLPILQIDYVFCDKKIRVDNYGILKEKLSDHYPVWADLRI